MPKKASGNQADTDRDQAPSTQRYKTRGHDAHLETISHCIGCLEQQANLALR
jgi:hypothetical protein